VRSERPFINNFFSTKQSHHIYFFSSFFSFVFFHCSSSPELFLTVGSNAVTIAASFLFFSYSLYRKRKMREKKPHTFPPMKHVTLLCAGRQLGGEREYSLFVKRRQRDLQTNFLSIILNNTM
jgi:hypothetical protein